MNILHDFLCGAVVGVANIIPGVSGGTMAVVLGVYQQLLETMGLKNLKKNIPFLIPFGAGCGLGILAFSRAIEFLLANYPMATNFVFIGLILGSIPMIWKKTKEQTDKNLLWLNGAAFALMLALMLLLNSATGGNPDLITEVDLNTALYLAAVGAVSSFAMLLPGISGSFVMLLLGAYPSVLAAISRFDFLILIPTACGIGIGLLAGSRLISWLLERFPQPTYFGIMGLILGSLPGIFPGFAFTMEGIIAVALMCAAAAFTMWFSRRGE
ncbi:MAG: DUF368 domain-containing protein [Oscillospiraceae bacterium]|nr:DUF368 domain-containing protein [Oscillospiraceae bacterium]